MVFSIMFGQAMEAVEPTLRNSNLFPVKANGEVRLRSVVSRGKRGRTSVPTSMKALSFCS